jgi:aspartate/methionine/tyrosine aminotransferase
MIERPSSAALTARDSVLRLTASQIREVANAGLGDPDVLPFWFGEPDEVTPAFIRNAGIASIERGETFYTENLGVTALREAVAAYVSGLHRATAPDEIAATSSGMSALMLATQALVEPGDRVVIVTPLWPNLTEIPKILAGAVTRIPLAFSPMGWTLDLDRLIDALTPGTRAVVINSPNNPTGWTIDVPALQAILAHCRRHGIWIIADDVYERLYYRPSPSALICAPGFLDYATRDDRVISTNSFSKAWLMTGWRLGWIVAPPTLVAHLATLIEYNTSCSPTFVQRAGVVALGDGEGVVSHTRERFRHARDLMVRELNAMPGVAAAVPDGAMYAFFRVDGVRDSLAFCKALVREAKLGLAPGGAFGAEAEGFVRWCFAASDARLNGGLDRLRAFLATRESHSLA